MTETADTSPRTHADIGPVAWVHSRDDLDHLLAAIAGAEYLVMDLETTGLEPHAYRGGPMNGGVAGRIVMAAFTLPQSGYRGEPTSWVLPLSHPHSPFLGQWREVMTEVAQAMAASGRPLINQNVKFDTQWVYAHTGVDLTGIIYWDTQISSHLLDESRSTRLKDRAPETFNIPPWNDHDLSFPGAAEQVDYFDLGIYAARDTYWTYKLFENHHALLYVYEEEPPQTSDEVQLTRLGDLARWCAMPTVAALGRMEQHGFTLDRQWVKEHLAEDEEASERLKAKLAARYSDLDPDNISFAATSKWFQAFTELAVADGSLRVAALTPSGKAQWNKSVLTRQAAGGSEVAKDLLDQRSHAKRAEYLRSYLDHADQDGLIHATYFAGRVVTGRLSCGDPNMQQVTRALKPAFIPRPGCVIVDIDYSQIELRVAAYVSRCEPMLEAFRAGQDLHATLAATMFGKPLEEVTPEERQAAKAGNFGLLYGMGADGFRIYAADAYGVEMTDDEAAAMRHAFFSTWEGMAQWHDKQITAVRERGEVVSPIGRVRRLPEVFSANMKRASYSERVAINAPVQGFASDLMQLAIASISGLQPGSHAIAGAQPVATVHDSVVLEVNADNWEEITEAALDRMVNVNGVLRRMGCKLDVPIAAEATIGTRWGLADIGEMSATTTRY